MKNKSEKYTKKASAYIMKYLIKQYPNISKLTSFNQAFEILMKDWNLEIDMYTKLGGDTICNLYSENNNIIYTFNWKSGIFDSETGNWNWDIIYKDILETIIKKKLYKPLKKKCSSKNSKSK